MAAIWRWRSGGASAIHPVSGVLAYPSVLATVEGVRDGVLAALSRRQQPILLAGDCTALIGVCAALEERLGGFGLAYVDGHFDLYDGGTSPTGESADMPLAVIIGRGPAGLRRLAARSPMVRTEEVVLIGPRDRARATTDGSLLPEDLAGATTVFEAPAVRDLGPARVAAEALPRLTADGRPFWLHLDLDVLDEAAFPATDDLQPGGLDWDQLAALLAPLARSPHCLGADVACYNPEKDEGRRQAARVVALLGEVFGRP